MISYLICILGSTDSLPRLLQKFHTLAVLLLDNRVHLLQLLFKHIHAGRCLSAFNVLLQLAKDNLPFAGSERSNALLQVLILPVLQWSRSLRLNEACSGLGNVLPSRWRIL
jgi:hypothetical protein